MTESQFGDFLPASLYIDQALRVGILKPLPDLVEQVLDGRQPRHLSIARLLAKPLAYSWDQQRAQFAMKSSPLPYQQSQTHLSADGKYLLVGSGGHIKLVGVTE